MRRVHVLYDHDGGVYYVLAPGAGRWELPRLRVVEHEADLAELLDRLSRLPWLRVAPR